MKRLSIIVWLACLVLGSSPLFASHNRGCDADVILFGDGAATVSVTTRWAKGTIGSPESSGVDSDRFGLTVFDCEQNGTVVTLVPATGMRVVRVSDATVVYDVPIGSFSLSGTTVLVDTSNPAYDARVQQLVLPFGTAAPPNAIGAPLNLPYDDYDIVWNDWARVDGIQNLPPNADCQSLDSGFGFRLRVHWDGAAHQGPHFEAPFGAAIVRGLDYSQQLSARDDDGDTFTYTLVPANPQFPDFGPLNQIPGLVLTPAGELTIPAASTIGLLDNSQGVAGADYLLRVRVADSTGMVSELDTLLDVVAGPAERINELLALLQRLPVAPNVKKVLTKKLQAALDAIDAQDGAAACAELQDFNNQVNGFKRSRKLTAAQAAELTGEANEIGALLGCQSATQGDQAVPLRHSNPTSPIG